MKFSLLGSLVALLAFVGCSKEPTAPRVSTMPVSTAPTLTPVASTIDLADPLASTPSDPFFESTGLPIGDDGAVPGTTTWDLETPLIGQGAVDVLPVHGQSQHLDLGLDSASIDSGALLP